MQPATASKPDGWWYDGGGLYRSAWLVVAPTVHIIPEGNYLPTTVTGAITWAGGAPFADVTMAPATEIAK